VPATERVFWRSDTCRVWVGYDDAGADVLDLVCAHVDDIMARGERTWLDDHGIDRAFRSH